MSERDQHTTIDIEQLDQNIEAALEMAVASPFWTPDMREGATALATYLRSVLRIAADRRAELELERLRDRFMPRSDLS